MNQNRQGVLLDRNSSAKPLSVQKTWHARLSQWFRRSTEPTSVAETGDPHLTVVDLEQILNAKSDIAGAYETLLSGLELTGRNRPLKRLLVTSAQPNEGKTTVCVNLALTMARVGLKVVLVDGDLRRPSLHRVMGITNELGTSDIITGRAKFPAVTQTVTTPNQPIMVVPSGLTSPDAIHELSKLPAALADTEIANDFVIVDSPPVLSANDATVLSDGLDGVLFVIKAGEATHSDVSTARERLELSGASIVGSVLNALVDEHSTPYHPYAYYAHEDRP